MMQTLPASFGKGGSNLTDGTLQSILQELRGLTISAVAGAPAGTKMVIADIRPEDTIISAQMQGGVVSLGEAETQTITVSATDGSWTITFDGQTTGAIAWNASAAAVQAALVALNNVAPEDVVVTGGPGDAAGTTPYLLTWSPYLGDVAEPTTTVTDLVGVQTAAVATTNQGVQQVGGMFTDDKDNITIQPCIASGSFTVSGQPANNQTFTVNDVVYRFRTAGTKETSQDVVIGAANQGGYDAMALGMANAINTYESRLTHLGYNTPAVSATSLAGVCTVTSLASGAGSSIAATGTVTTLAEDATNPGAVTLTPVSAVQDNTVTISDVTFTARDVPAVHDLSNEADLDWWVEFDVKATDALQGVELARVINAYEQQYRTLGVVATANGVTGVVTLTPDSLKVGNGITLNEAADNVAHTGAGFLTGGTNSGGIKSTTDLSGESLVVYWYNKQ